MTRTARLRITLVALAGAWVIAARWVIPALIRWVYAGHGPGFLGRLMPGRGRVPVAQYLDGWQGALWPVTFVVVTLLALAWLLLPLLLERREGDAEPGAPLSPGSVVLVCAWAGLACGLAEGWYYAWKRLVLRQIVPHFAYVSIDSTWMAPVADVALFVIIGLLLYALARGRLRLALLLQVLAVLGLASLIVMTGRLSRPAAGILALGIGIRVGAVAGRHQRAILAWMQRWVPRLAAVVVAVMIAAVAGPALRERRAMARVPAPTGNPPSVLLLIIDTQRAANLSLYGYGRRTSPAIDRWAREGTVYDRAIAPAPWTLPSHAAMFTGRKPNELSASFVTPLDGEWPTLAEVLRDRGYRTAGFVGNITFGSPLFGLDRGFVHYESQPRNLAMLRESSTLFRGVRQLIQSDPDHEMGVFRTADDITGAFLRWQAGQAGRPFFAFLNIFDAHGPYVSPARFAGRFADPAVPLAFHGEPAANYTPAQLKRIEDAYDGATAYVDSTIGVLLDSLRARRLLEQTLVIITADHGEEFGEHGYVGHVYGIHGQLLHVPLVVLGPGFPAGRRVTAPVSLLDVGTTIARAAGAPAPSFRGRPWQAADSAGEPAFSEYKGRRSIVVDRWHFIRDGRESLYDWSTDLGERTDLIGRADSALVAQLRRQLDSIAALD